jgi:hypothetical protein
VNFFIFSLYRDFALFHNLNSHFISRFFCFADNHDRLVFTHTLTCSTVCSLSFSSLSSQPQWLIFHCLHTTLTHTHPKCLQRKPEAILFVLSSFVSSLVISCAPRIETLVRHFRSISFPIVSQSDRSVLNRKLLCLFNCRPSDVCHTLRTTLRTPSALQMIN